MIQTIQSEEIYQKLLTKLEKTAERYAELEKLLSDEDVMKNNAHYVSLVKEHGSLADAVKKYQALKDCEEQIGEARAILDSPDSEPELAELAREDLAEAEARKERVFNEVLDLWLADDKEEQASVVMEIRAGTGGEEAALFAGDLFRMYQHYAEKKGWKAEVVDASPTDLGGFREIILTISGRGVYKRLRYESGGHRVQRVPITESQGRIHTSLATVAVMPEVQDVSVELNREDLDIQRIRSQGPGGQKVNKTSSCVRVIHKPTGLIVRCQDEKSQYRNLDRAMKILASKLHSIKESALHKSRDALRRSQVGSGDRNERIRTYNFPQDRMTDHRIGFDLFGLDKILMGELDPLFDALADYDKHARLKAFAMEQN